MPESTRGVLGLQKLDDPYRLDTAHLPKKCGNGELAEVFKQSSILVINFGSSDEKGLD